MYNRYQKVSVKPNWDPEWLTFGFSRLRALRQTLITGHKKQPTAYCVRRCISHTPRAVFPAGLLDNQEGANTERYVFRKLSACCFQRRNSWRRHYPNCGDIDLGKSAQGCAWYTPCRRKRYTPSTTPYGGMATLLLCSHLGRYWRAPRWRTL